MSWITVIWSMTASACITLALMNLFIWCRQRDAWANLLFALVAVGTAAIAGFELAMMRAETIASFSLALRWLHLPACVVVLSLAWFVRLFLNAGRPWLLWSICGLHLFSLLLNFLLGESLNYWQITRLHPVPFLGESVPLPEGVLNHWMLVGQASFVLLLVFVVDATITGWRLGDRQRALVVGGSVVFFVLVATGEATLVLWHVVHWPIIASLPAQVMVAGMSFELSRDAQRAARLGRELRESEQRLDLAARAAELGLWVWNIVHDEIWTTDPGRRLFGIPQSERITFDRFMNTLHPGDREPVSQAVAKSFNGDGDYECEYRVIVPGRPLRWIAARGSVEFNHARKPVFMRGVSVDITERKQSEEKFRLAVEASPNGIVLANDHGRIVLVNARTEELFGYLREELIGQAVEVLVPQRYRARHSGHRAEFFATPQRRAMGAGRELFALRKDGTEFPVEVGLSPIQSAEGTLVLTVIVDITARRLAEAEALRQREELAHLSRVTTVSELSGSLAHELNQPLAIILTNAQAAQRILNQSPPDLAEARDILDDIVMENERAGEVIRRVRSLLKPGETHMQPLSVNEVIEEVLRLTRSDLIGRGVTLHQVFAADLPQVLGDRIQLQQVLLNLIINACDAMAAVPPAGRLLAVATGQHNGAVRISVSDNGSGLPSEPERVFEPFFTTKKHGLGLGLPICRSIITAHKGRLWAEANTTEGVAAAATTTGHGATFHFELPAIAVAKA